VCARVWPKGPCVRVFSKQQPMPCVVRLVAGAYGSDPSALRRPAYATWLAPAPLQASPPNRKPPLSRADLGAPLRPNRFRRAAWADPDSSVPLGQKQSCQRMRCFYKVCCSCRKAVQPHQKRERRCRCATDRRTLSTNRNSG
jgi:hypothetical protein